MSIVPINIGSAPNDGTGQNLRSGAQVINANFSELDQRTTAAQSAADGAQATADAAISGAQKGQPNGVAGLDGNGTVPASQLPSYVDDVLEFNSFAALPATGETGKIYITIDNNNQYRWSGTQYVLLTASPGTTDSVPEGAVNKYWTVARTLGSVLTGLVTTNPAVVAATDTVLAAFGKLQRQVSDLASNKANKGANSDITSLTGLTTPLAVDQGGTGSASGVPDMIGASSSSAGTKGLVPAPTAGATRFLSSLGTWLAVNASASWGGITGTLADQADLKSALDAKQSISSAPFTKFYQSPNTAWAASGLIEFTHNLGQPKMVQIYAVLTAATGNYPVGTIFSLCVWINTNYWGAMVVAETATVVRVRMASALGLLVSAGSAETISPSNSQIFVRVAA
ncbi:hypothetical protein [Pseudomonas sp. OV546]|uniref:hypothetical protein n=1 Tax=Pseudomonas sp. OV546 TaxID=1881063 RepID=UPI0008E2C581|nr:hypothetical protein [Pseudomonas sp. OV546]SFU97685.1 hypothetical protein SAMN05428951_107292 [Pseudomonas sp. OV546]